MSGGDLICLFKVFTHLFKHFSVT